MLNLLIGIALGAAFSKFWLSAWSWAVSEIKALLNKDKS